MSLNPDILIVIATLVGLLSVSSMVASWANRVWPVKAFLAFAMALAVLGYVHVSLREGGLTAWAIPDAFIHVVAMVLN